VPDDPTGHTDTRTIVVELKEPRSAGSVSSEETLGPSG
jgi:hypothetical protein